MGYGSYTASDWTKLKRSRNLDTKQHVTEIYTRTSCDPKYDPKYIGTRECFDSDEHPHSTPIVIGLDVTGSMGYLAVRIAREALNDLIMKLYSTGVVEDPALMCAAYGDMRDKSPLQVTQFESDIRIAEQLLELYFENGGDGSVVPTCLWEFLSRHTKIDAIEKRHEKGFVFTIGDYAKIRQFQVADTIFRVIGDRIGPASVTSILREVQQKFHVFHIMIDGDWNPDILHGQKMVITRNELDIIPEIILGAIRLQKGESMKAVLRDCDQNKVPHVKQALDQLSVAKRFGFLRR
ncbi:MAG: hypothetical protein IJ083_08120 [Clostridia bacterium]|nr:hypothetical protein [Clostridia bacterium]